jgi:hypothetical protein
MMIENRETVLEMIRERLAPHGFDPAATFPERIWIAAVPSPDSGHITERFMRYLDSLGSKV